jgi:exonuclease V gamma subunit
MRGRASERMAGACTARWPVTLATIETQRYQGLQLWLEHLVYCASGGVGKSVICPQWWRMAFPAMKPDDALQHWRS